VEDWADAVRRRDLPAVLLNHSSDILMFDVPPPFLSHGIDAYAKTWDLFFAWARDPAVFDIKEMNITASNDVAFVTAAMRCAGTTDGKDMELDFRLTIGLRKSAATGRSSTSTIRCPPTDRGTHGVPIQILTARA
jgi:ketosteroid isomerase-like protein